MSGFFGKHTETQTNAEARKAIKTNFYVPETEADWLDIKKDERNCLVLYEDVLYHINSDKTIAKVGFNIKEEIWGKDCTYSQKDLAANIKIQDEPLSKEEKNSLSKAENKDMRYFIYNRENNTYSVYYHDNHQYQEKSLNLLLKDGELFDPNLNLALKTLNKSEKNVNFQDYLQTGLRAIETGIRSTTRHEAVSIAKRMAEGELITNNHLDLVSETEDDAGFKDTFYGEQTLKTYAYNEAFNNSLSYVVAQRQELWNRYKMSLEEQGIELLSAPIPKNKPVDKAKISIYFDAQQNQWTQYIYDADKGHVEKVYENKGYQEALQDLNRKILAEEYSVKILNKSEYNKLRRFIKLKGEATDTLKRLAQLDNAYKQAWDTELSYEEFEKVRLQRSYSLHTHVESHGNFRDVKLPLILKKGIVYVYCDDNDYECLCINPSGELQSTNKKSFNQRITEQKLKKTTPHSDVLEELLQNTEEAGITLDAQLVSPVFLDHCKAAQRLFDKISLIGDVLPLDKREKMLNVMTKMARDPTSSDVRDYLRDSYNMYITDGRPEIRQDNDAQSFYLDVKSNPKHPTLYQFQKNTNGVWEPVKVNLKPFYTTTPEKELYKIAKKQFDKNKANTMDQHDKDQVVKLSSQNVYHCIACQTTDGFKMNTAMEMIEEIHQAELRIKIRLAAFYSALILSFVASFLIIYFIFPIVLLTFLMYAAIGEISLLCIAGTSCAVANYDWFGEGDLPELRAYIHELNHCINTLNTGIFLPKAADEQSKAADEQSKAVDRQSKATDQQQLADDFVEIDLNAANPRSDKNSP